MAASGEGEAGRKTADGSLSSTKTFARVWKSMSKRSEDQNTGKGKIPIVLPHASYHNSTWLMRKIIHWCPGWQSKAMVSERFSRCNNRRSRVAFRKQKKKNWKRAEWRDQHVFVTHASSSTQKLGCLCFARHFVRLRTSNRMLGYWSKKKMSHRRKPQNK